MCVVFLLNQTPTITEQTNSLQAARKKEREQAAAFREGRLGITTVGHTAVRVEDKYKHMLVSSMDPKKAEGAADDAWDD
jgi:ATP-dependent RNA helicase DDX5/DBP2